MFGRGSAESHRSKKRVERVSETMVNITTPLLIIGAALPRTSTTSTKMALEQLGYKVLHALSSSKTIQDLWNRTAVADFHGHVDERQALMDQLVEQMSAEGFKATLDQPSCFFIKISWNIIQMPRY